MFIKVNWFGVLGTGSIIRKTEIDAVKSAEYMSQFHELQYSNIIPSLWGRKCRFARSYVHSAWSLWKMDVLYIHQVLNEIWAVSSATPEEPLGIRDEWVWFVWPFKTNKLYFVRVFVNTTSGFCKTRSVLGDLINHRGRCGEMIFFN